MEDVTTVVLEQTPTSLYSNYLEWDWQTWEQEGDPEGGEADVLRNEFIPQMRAVQEMVEERLTKKFSSKKDELWMHKLARKMHDSFGCPEMFELLDADGREFELYRSGDDNDCETEPEEEDDEEEEDVKEDEDKKEENVGSETIKESTVNRKRKPENLTKQNSKKKRMEKTEKKKKKKITKVRISKICPNDHVYSVVEKSKKKAEL